MNQKNLIKRIQQIQSQINELEQAKMDDTIRKEWLEGKEELKKYYNRQLKDLKWNLILSSSEQNNI